VWCAEAGGLIGAKNGFGGFTVLMETATSHLDLPLETLDHIVDLLHDNPQALRQCCLVSKSWVFRTQKHLFALVEFRSNENLNSWKNTFPDPMNSPAHHARTLTVKCHPGDTQEGSWIQHFSRVERLVLDCSSIPWITLVPFHVLAPSLKSVFVTSLYVLPSDLFNLIRSLFVLEDLMLSYSEVLDVGESKTPPPITSTSPALNGILNLFTCDDMEYILRPLLDYRGASAFEALCWRGATDKAYP
jgi:hypothetical protein